MAVLGAQLYTCREFTRTIEAVAETFRKVARTGYTAVQVSGFGDVDAKEVAKLAKEHPYKAHGMHSVGFRWAFGGLSAGFRWAFDGLSVGFRRAFGGLSAGFRRAFGGLSVGFRRAFGGLYLCYGACDPSEGSNQYRPSRNVQVHAPLSAWFTMYRKTFC